MNEQKSLPLSYRSLYSLYAFVPLGLAAVLIDRYGFHGALRAMLPRSPEDLRFLTIFIVLPHIVASASSFIDSDYLSFYKTRLLWGIPLVAFLTFGMPALFGTTLAFIVYALYTIFHVMAQQIGITTMMTGKPTPMFKGWKWCSIVTAAAVYFLIFADPRLWSVKAGPWSVKLWLDGAIIAGVAAVAIVGALAARTSRTPIGRQYLWANTVMIGAAALSVFLGYSFFAILIPRLIHDLSGFFFYVAHDANRNTPQVRNAFYRLFSFTKIPIVVLSPVLAIVIANGLIEAKQFVPWLGQALFGLAYFHYYTEGFMWKRDAVHRKSVPVGSPFPIPAMQISPAAVSLPQAS